MRSTYFGLLAEFGTAEISLEDCCERYFGLSPDKAKRAALARSLPVPAYRAAPSQKAGWLICAARLAEHLDKEKANEDKLHAAIHGAGKSAA